jgi:hypothetical protein
MKVIFESETELGRCDPDRVDGLFGQESGDWLAFAHTSATLTGRMLRIEQHCYLRPSEALEDVRAQSWVKAEMAFEPLLGSKTENLKSVQRLHEGYVQKAQEELLEVSVILVPSLV